VRVLTDPNPHKVFMDNTFYTYAYLREDGSPYYVGKGKGRRAFRRERAIPVPPRERILFLKKNLTEEEAFRHEVYMIAILGRKNQGTGILRNLTDGGEGHSGFIISEERREQMRARRGWKHSAESRKKISQTKLGHPTSSETRRKISEAMTGKKRKPCSEATKKRISEAKRKKKEDAT
jgi:hypothetical protein